MGHAPDFVLEEVNRKPLSDSMSEVTCRPLMMISRGLVDLLSPRLLGSEHHAGDLKVQSQTAFLKCGVSKHLFPLENSQKLRTIKFKQLPFPSSPQCLQMPFIKHTKLNIAP